MQTSTCVRGTKRGLCIDLSVISPSNPLGTPDGSVRFKRRLGAGSEGEVFMGLNVHGVKVAVKVVQHDAQERLRALQSMVSTPRSASEV